MASSADALVDAVASVVTTWTSVVLPAASTDPRLLQLCSTALSAIVSVQLSVSKHGGSTPRKRAKLDTSAAAPATHTGSSGSAAAASSAAAEPSATAITSAPAPTIAAAAALAPPSSQWLPKQEAITVEDDAHDAPPASKPASRKRKRSPAAAAPADADDTEEEDVAPAPIVAAAAPVKASPKRSPVRSRAGAASLPAHSSSSAAASSSAAVSATSAAPAPAPPKVLQSSSSASTSAAAPSSATVVVVPHSLKAAAATLQQRLRELQAAVASKDPAALKTALRALRPTPFSSLSAVFVAADGPALLVRTLHNMVADGFATNDELLAWEAVVTAWLTSAASSVTEFFSKAAGLAELRTTVTAITGLRATERSHSVAVQLIALMRHAPALLAPTDPLVAQLAVSVRRSVDNMPVSSSACLQRLEPTLRGLIMMMEANPTLRSQWALRGGMAAMSALINAAQRVLTETKRGIELLLTIMRELVTVIHACEQVKQSAAAVAAFAEAKGFGVVATCIAGLPSSDVSLVRDVLHELLDLSSKHGAAALAGSSLPAAYFLLAHRMFATSPATAAALPHLLDRIAALGDATSRATLTTRPCFDLTVLSLQSGYTAPAQKLACLKALSALLAGDGEGAISTWVAAGGMAFLAQGTRGTDSKLVAACVGLTKQCSKVSIARAAFLAAGGPASAL